MPTAAETVVDSGGGGAWMVKSASLVSEAAVLPLPDTFILALLVVGPVIIHFQLPSLFVELMRVVQLVPLLEDSSIFTEPIAPVRLQVIVWVSPIVQGSPPFGEITVIVGGGGAAYTAETPAHDTIETRASANKKYLPTLKNRGNDSLCLYFRIFPPSLIVVCSITLLPCLRYIHILHPLLSLTTLHMLPTDNIDLSFVNSFLEPHLPNKKPTIFRSVSLLAPH
jgi:hypothetical protein